MAQEDFVVGWYYTDLTMMQSMKDADFLMYKTNKRRIGSDRIKNRFKKLQGEDKQLKQTIKELKAEKKDLQKALKKSNNRIEELETSFSYKLGRTLTTPVRLVRDRGADTK